MEFYNNIFQKMLSLINIHQYSRYTNKRLSKQKKLLEQCEFL